MQSMINNGTALLYSLLKPPFRGYGRACPGPNAARGGHHLCFSVVINTDQVISAVRRFYPGWDPRAAHRRTTLYRSPLSGLAGLVSTLPGHDHLGLNTAFGLQGLLQDSGFTAQREIDGRVQS